MILDNLSLTIRAGESTAIVGSTGSGKSTIMRLIYRFYDTDEGTILIDGQDIRNITIDDLRQKIAIVPQDCVLFNDTLRYNIAYGGVKDPEINKLMNDPDRQEELEAKIIATAKKA
jgi:ABC-type multidrug transport system fused ATPase/permease subunit